VGALDAVAAAGLVEVDAALLSAAPEPIEPAA
jgi:hypothetical protein